MVNIIVPSTVINIKENAFKNCTSLKNVFLLSNEIVKIVYSSSDANIYVYANLYDSYLLKNPSLKFVSTEYLPPYINVNEYVNNSNISITKTDSNFDILNIYIDNQLIDINDLEITDNGYKNIMANLPDGEYTLKCSDIFGHFSTVTFILDNTIPSVNIDNNGCYQLISKLSFNDENIDYATLNNERIENEISVEIDGTYNLVVVDKAGNQKNITFIIDNVSPLIGYIDSSNEYVSIKDKAYFSNEITEITLSIIDDTPITSLTVNGNNHDISTPIEISNGSYIIETIDSAGNNSVIVFYYDNELPQVFGNNQIIDSDQIFNEVLYLSFSDNSLQYTNTKEVGIAKVVITKEGATQDIVITDVADSYVLNSGGNYTLKAIDKSGNETIVTFIIDFTKPVINANTKDNIRIVNNGYYNTSVINITFYDNVGISTINELLIFSESLEVTEEGVYEYIVVDKAGNKDSIIFYIDRTLPVISGLTNNENKYTSLTLQIYEDNIKEILINNNKVEINNSFMFDENGSYEFIVVDKADNQTRVSFVIDVEAPVLNYTYDKNGNIVLNSISSDAEIIIFKDGVRYNASAGDKLNRNGSYEIIVRDSLNNETKYTLVVEKDYNELKTSLIIVSIVILISLFILFVRSLTLTIEVKKDNYNNVLYWKVKKRGGLTPRLDVRNGCKALIYSNNELKEIINESENYKKKPIVSWPGLRIYGVNTEQIMNLRFTFLGQPFTKVLTIQINSISKFIKAINDNFKNVKKETITKQDIESIINNDVDLKKCSKGINIESILYDKLEKMGFKVIKGENQNGI